MSTDMRIRDYCLRTNLDLFLIGIIFAGYSYYADAAAVNTTSDVHGTTSTEEEAESKAEVAVTAVFFPWFAQAVGLVVYYVLSRYARAIPFTAMMFLIGLAVGVAVEVVTAKGTVPSVPVESAATWMRIPGELLLLVFLPGLLYVDAYGIDVHLFLKSFSQLITFAFPMVLAGTALTALVAYYILPYGWSFDLAMTFGAILSATDPVAVSVLMNELGAPPRLRMHISGESLLNDGSAYVFFNIFRARFLYQLNIPDIGRNIGWGEGFKLFFQLSLGGMCIGIGFGLGTVMVLYKLKHRLSGEDSVAQVVLTISVAYLTYFTSELAHCSGIIGVLFVGLTVKAFGENLINNTHLMHHFWEITEWLLNTLLFTLAGCVFGGMLVDSNKQIAENERIFEPQDWGYLFVLFFLLQAIRFFLIFAFYPLISAIGIGTSWQEAIFMSYSGLRGAVGLALALSLNAEVYEITPDEMYRDYSAKLFFLTGGIAMLTLVINAPTCGPVLKKLGLVTPTETRLKIISKYHRRMIHHSLIEYVSLLADERFHDLDFAVVREHVPFLRDITYDQLKAAVKRHHVSIH
jgi:NhaP-type Na+/H+ or K+/H+ antiporter